MKTISLFASVSIALLLCPTLLSAQTSAVKTENVVYRGSPSSAISSSVTIPAGKKYFYSSGTLGPIVDSTAVAGKRERYGDTKAQSIGILEKFKSDLGKEGLTLGNIV